MRHNLMNRQILLKTPGQFRNNPIAAAWIAAGKLRCELAEEMARVATFADDVAYRRFVRALKTSLGEAERGIKRMCGQRIAMAAHALGIDAAQLQRDYSDWCDKHMGPIRHTGRPAKDPPAAMLAAAWSAQRRHWPMFDDGEDEDLIRIEIYGKEAA